MASNANGHEFTSPFKLSEHSKPVTLVELRMRRFSGEIRAKPRWWEKLEEPAIAARWREEIVAQDAALVDKLWGGEERYRDNRKRWPRDPMTEAQVDYIFEELRYEASQRDPVTGIFVSTLDDLVLEANLVTYELLQATSVPKVYESHSLIPAALRGELVNAVKLLEDVPDDQKDWHPGSNEQVLDLVHPSLHCLRIGESLVRDEATGTSEVITEEAYKTARPDVRAFLPHDGRWPFDRYAYIVSTKYQWLPTDFEVSHGGDVKPLAYINNIHPSRHAALYPPITSILSRFLPLFERVLSDVLSPERPLAVTVDPMAWYDLTTHPPPDWFEQEAYDQWEHDYGWPVVPDPAPFQPPDPTQRIPYPLRGRKLQVIVKLANIHLTPDRPAYPGGAWHVEGMANESIVATGLYYYACENISESRLAFRAAVGGAHDALEYEQNDFRGWDVVYGFTDDDPLNQPLGHIVAAEGKCVAFPNVYQHRVEPFELADPTRPGHRKILCFFLVNPEVEILSTTRVSPQQEDWVMEEVGRAPALQDLPVELFKLIAEHVCEGLLSREEAERHREELMQERSNFVVKFNKHVYEIEFSMCEH